MLRSLLLAALTAAVLGTAPSLAHAALYDFDQTNGPSDDPRFEPVTAAVQRSQVFVPSQDGRLYGLYLYLLPEGVPGPIVVQVQPMIGGVPTGTVLAEEQTIDWGDPAPIIFAEAPPLRGGVPYAIVLSSPGTVGAGTQWGVRISDDTYDKGTMLVRAGADPWTPVPAMDFGFASLMNFIPPDVGPPASTVTPAVPSGATGWWHGPIGLTVTASDGAGIGLDETRCWLDPATPPATFAAPGGGPCPTTVEGEGAHTLYVASRDLFGQAETPRPHALNIDGTAPMTTDAGIARERTAGPQTVTLTAADGSGSGVVATYYEIGVDPAKPTAASPVYDPAGKPVLRDGERIRYFSVDRAGNVEPSTTSRAADVGFPSAPAPEVRTETRVETRTVPAPPVTTTTTASARLGPGRAVRVAVGCGRSACRATVTAEVRTGKKVVARVKARAVQVAAGRTRVVKLTLTRAQRKKAGKAARVVVSVRIEGTAAPSVERG